MSLRLMGSTVVLALGSEHPAPLLTSLQQLSKLCESSPSLSEGSH